MNNALAESVRDRQFLQGTVEGDWRERDEHNEVWTQCLVSFGEQPASQYLCV